MSKAEKLSPSPTYSKSGSNRSKMIVKAVRRTDENVTRQNACENPPMKMDETVETERETIETDKKWQAVSNQRSNKIQKLMKLIHTSLSEQITHALHLSFLNMPLRNRLLFDHQHKLKEKERERICHRSNWNSTLNRNQWRSNYSTSFWSTTVDWMWMQLLIQRIINHNMYIPTKWSYISSYYIHTQPTIKWHLSNCVAFLSSKKHRQTFDWTPCYW